MLYLICTYEGSQKYFMLCFFLCFTYKGREALTANLSPIDSREEDSTFLMKSIYINGPSFPPQQTNKY